MWLQSVRLLSMLHPQSSTVLVLGYTPSLLFFVVTLSCWFLRCKKAQLEIRITSPFGAGKESDCIGDQTQHFDTFRCTFRMLVAQFNLFNDQAKKHLCTTNLLNLTTSLKNRYYFRSLYSQRGETGPYLASATVFFHYFCKASAHFKHSKWVQ